ncbi:hypothetical protein GPALN_014615 [Globodera pallida]|nr:hypothetical protein GPALN_014615 [Globodera pallida]
MDNDDWVQIGTLPTMEAVFAYCKARKLYRNRILLDSAYFRCYRTQHHGCTYRFQQYLDGVIKMFKEKINTPSELEFSVLLYNCFDFEISLQQDFDINLSPFSEADVSTSSFGKFFGRSSSRSVCSDWL